jgi:ankyrin repeat protein
MARDAFIDNPAEEDKNCSIHNIFTLLGNEEEEEELDVVLASTDSPAGAGAIHVADHADVTAAQDNINAIDNGGWTALHNALWEKASWEVINGLLGKLDEKVINATENFLGRNALHIACDTNRASWEVINGLLGKLDGKVINATDKIGQSALHRACESKASWEVINGLLGKLNEEAINAIEKYGHSALHTACANGASWEVINGLLGKLKEKAINAIDKDGSSALHTACANGASWEVINGLLGKLNEKAINSIDTNFGVRTALHIAIKRGSSWEVINGLLGKLDEKTISATTSWDGATAFHLACAEDETSLEVINGLLGKLDEKVINAITNFEQKNALHYACDHEVSLEVISAIVTHNKGTKLVSVKNVNGKLPFDITENEKNRDKQLKKLLKLHDLMEANDLTASLYPNGLLQSILNLPSEDRDEFEFMNHSYFRKGINAKIIQPFSLSILFLDVAVQGLVMAVFSFTINGAVKELPTTSMAGLIPCLLWLLFREIVQYLSATVKFYFGDAANFVDIIQIVLVIVVLLISFIGKGSIDEGLLVACIGVAWTRLIFVISNLHYSLALFVAALLQVSSSWYIDYTILAMVYFLYVFC